MFVILDLTNMVKYFPDFLWQNRSRLNIYKGAVGLLGTHTESLPQGHCSGQCLSLWPNELASAHGQVFCKARWPKANLTLFGYKAPPSLDTVSDCAVSFGVVCLFVCLYWFYFYFFNRVMSCSPG